MLQNFSINHRKNSTKIRTCKEHPTAPPLRATMKRHLSRTTARHVAERHNGLLTTHVRRGKAEPYVRGKRNSLPNSVAARLNCIPRYHYIAQHSNTQPYTALLACSAVAPRLRPLGHIANLAQTVRLRLTACARLTGHIVAPRHAVQRLLHVKA